MSSVKKIFYTKLERYGEKMNLPNKITIFRVFMIPLFVVLMMLQRIPGNEFYALAVYAIACISDAVDGHIARKYNLITDFGKFMDPVADKLLVCSALICFVEQGLMMAWVALIIIARELIIDGFRLVAASKGIVIAASIWGKAKTVVQMIACFVLILNVDMLVFYIAEQVLIYASLILTVISLTDYIYKNRTVLTEGTR